MKKYIIIVIMALVALAGCSKYDDSFLRGELSSQQDEINNIKRDIESIKALLKTIQEEEHVINVEFNEDSNDYVLIFKSGKQITIHNGIDGVNGLNGENGITPIFKIVDGYWYVSYDGGNNYDRIGKATGDNGKDGKDGAKGDKGEDGKDSTGAVITQDDENVYITFADGTVITLKKDKSIEEINERNVISLDKEFIVDSEMQKYRYDGSLYGYYKELETYSGKWRYMLSSIGFYQSDSPSDSLAISNNTITLRAASKGEKEKYYTWCVSLISPNFDKPIKSVTVHYTKETGIGDRCYMFKYKDSFYHRGGLMIHFDINEFIKESLCSFVKKN